MPDSLFGLTVAVTSSRRAKELVQLVKNFGGTPYLAPSVETRRLNISSEVDRFRELVISERIDYLVIISSLGTILFEEAIRDRDSEIVQKFSKIAIVARSPKVKGALSSLGLNKVFLPVEATIDGISSYFLPLSLEGKRIAIVWHGARANRLRQKLHDCGAEIFEFQPYEYFFETNGSSSEEFSCRPVKSIVELINDVIIGRIDAITFTSPPSVGNVFQKAESLSLRGEFVKSLNSRVIVAAVGSSTSESLEQRGVKVNVIPKIFKMGAMVSALADYVRSQGESNIPSKFSSFIPAELSVI